MSNQAQYTVKSAVKKTISKWESEQKKVFINKASDPHLPYADFIDFVENEIKQSKRMASFNHKILCFKNDGVYQLNRAIGEIFGMVSAIEKSAGPSGGDSAINMIEVILADGQRIKVPYGDIALSELGEGGSISISYNSDNYNLYIKGKCQTKFNSLIDDIIDRTKELLATESIYKNQAISITDLVDPQLMDLSNIDKEMMILSEEVKYALQPLEARICHTQKCIEKGIDLKLGILLSGGYGCGKTLVAFKLAKQAIDNNWIFVYLKDPTLLAETIRLCKVIDKSGHGAIIFTEDIDQVTTGARDEAMQDILNTLDGGDTKGMNVITLFTTNHIEKINPTFLRGKRIGSVINLGPLDKNTAKEFIEKSFDCCYTLNGDFTPIYELIERSNIVPAFMAEIVESVKSHMVFMDTTLVEPVYLKNSVNSYMHQVSLSQKKDDGKTPEMILADSLKKVLGTGEMLQKMKDAWD